MSENRGGDLRGLLFGSEVAETGEDRGAGVGDHGRELGDEVAADHAGTLGPAQEDRPRGDRRESLRAGRVEGGLDAMLDQVGLQQSVHRGPAARADGQAQHRSDVAQRHHRKRSRRKTGVLDHQGKGAPPVTLFEKLLVAVEPAGSELAADRHARFVDEDLIEDRSPAGGLEHDQAAEAVTEHGGGVGGSSHGEQVGALVVDRVPGTLRSAARSPPAIHDVHLEVAGQGTGQAEIVLAAAQDAADDDQSRAAAE
ncbi:MAG TPA: hypothetical protein VG165_16340 [Solirubrobacteraceae bacterium]|nr:hypothetical protein [Solirubrobacteraceae bacterium]